MKKPYANIDGEWIIDTNFKIKLSQLPTLYNNQELIKKVLDKNKLVVNYNLKVEKWKLEIKLNYK